LPNGHSVTCPLTSNSVLCGLNRRFEDHNKLYDACFFRTSSQFEQNRLKRAVQGALPQRNTINDIDFIAQFLIRLHSICYSFLNIVHAHRLRPTQNRTSSIHADIHNGLHWIVDEEQRGHGKQPPDIQRNPTTNRGSLRV